MKEIDLVDMIVCLSRVLCAYYKYHKHDKHDFLLRIITNLQKTLVNRLCEDKEEC